MKGEFILDSEIYSWIILPAIIFIARVCDVSVGTVRVVFLLRNKKLMASLAGFLEILIWISVMGQIFKNLDNAACFIAYAGGFAMGNYVGLTIENKLAVGLEVVRIITRNNAGELIRNMESDGYGVTIVDGEGATGPVKIIFTVIKRRELPCIVELIHKHNPESFFSVEDVRMIERGIFPHTYASQRNVFWYLFHAHRKAK
ncbi:MAG: DUF2179 domain-containing protein [Deferribacteres bacterium]|nr:DUF2179 domain-containing protein [candidate division KSB1 bacterium]MCB9510151.1 DUF2179 domain-containing protein [Deferribacteres bacterium]